MRLAGLVSLLWVLFSLIGYIVYSVFDRGDGSFYDIAASNTNYTDSVLAHLMSAAAIWLGARFSIKILGLNCPSPIDFVKFDLNNRPDGLLRGVTVLSTIVCVVSNIYAYGLNDLLYRTYYIPDPGPAVTIAQMTGILSTLLASILACGVSRVTRIVALICYSIGFIMVFAKGSRYAVISVLIYQFLPMIVSPKTNFNIFSFFKIFLVIGFCYILMHASLYFRTDFQYGLMPYIGNISEAFSTLAEDEYKSFWDNFLNVTFSIPVTQVTIETALHDSYSMFVSLNPLPGDYAGWYNIADMRRVNDYVPFSAMGELYGYSPWLCLFYMLIVGVVFGIAEFEMTVSLPRIRVFFVLLIFAFVLLFSLLALQYNLRSTTRMVYYLLVVLLANRLITRFAVYNK